MSFQARADAPAAAAEAAAEPVWSQRVSPELHVDAFRGSRGYPASSSLSRGSGFQVYGTTTYQVSGNPVPDLRLDLSAKAGFVYSRQTTQGLRGSVDTPTDTLGSMTLTYTGLTGVQPYFSLNLNLPSGTTVLKGSAANARMDPDYVSVGTFGEGFNIGPSLGVTVPFDETLSASFSIGYTHRGAYNKEGAIDPTTFAQGTDVYKPGQNLTVSATVSYASAPWTTQASISYARESTTFNNATPSYRAGNRLIGSLSQGYAWSDTISSLFTGSLIYSGKNETSRSQPAAVPDRDVQLQQCRRTHPFRSVIRDRSMDADAVRHLRLPRA